MVGDVTDYDFLVNAIRQVQPDAIVHFAEQRSAPYSMIDRNHAVFTQVNNVVGTLNVLFAIRENGMSSRQAWHDGRVRHPQHRHRRGIYRDRAQRTSGSASVSEAVGSYYHLSKVHDSHNIMFACKTWGLRATDLNQGIVYGTVTDETQLDECLVNRFDYDEVFGTVLNRFCVQAAVEHPLTVYGKGGQTRGYLDLRDTVRCIELACESAPPAGECRVFNQFTEQFTVIELAQLVQGAAARMGLKTRIDCLPDPRVEREEHYYNARHVRLSELGLRPHLLSESLIDSLLNIALRYRDSIDASLFLPRIDWRRPRNTRSFSAYPETSEIAR